MAAIVTRNNRATRDTVAPPPALKENGDNYEWRMFYHNNEYAADADTLPELIELLIPDYTTEEPLTANNGYRLRLQYLAAARLMVQAEVYASLDDEAYDALQDWERNVLLYSETDNENLTTNYLTPYGWGEGEGELRGLGFGENVNVEDTESMDWWVSDVPLILIKDFYVPNSNLAEPMSPHGDYEVVPNMVKVSAESELDFLVSLDRLGLIVFGKPGVAD